MKRGEEHTLRKLAAALRLSGFDSEADGILEYIADGGAGWRNSVVFLAAVRRDIWWDYDQVGEPEERGLYQDAEMLVKNAQRELLRRNPAKKKPRSRTKKADRLVLTRLPGNLRRFRIGSSQDAALAGLEILGGHAYEAFLILHLDISNQVTSYDEATDLSPTHVSLDPRGIVRDAVMAAVPAIITIHQHPSGEPRPSLDDRQLWQKIKLLGEEFGVVSLDNLIVSDLGYYSQREDEAGVSTEFGRGVFEWFPKAKELIAKQQRSARRRK